MPRVILIHWNAAEAEERAERVRRAGYEAIPVADLSGPKARALGEAPPDIFVIDLSRLPSHGRDVAIYLRKHKSTRLVPFVFVDGEPEKVEKLRALLPDAFYTGWKAIKKTLRQASKIKLENVVVPDTFAAYADTPLPRKLGIRPGSGVLVLNAPRGFAKALGPLPANVELKKDANGTVRLVLLFVKSRLELNREFAPAARVLEDKGGIWIIWPKKGSKIETDLTQADVRQYGLAAAFVDYKVCAVDETWTGLLFTRRRS